MRTIASYVQASARAFDVPPAAITGAARDRSVASARRAVVLVVRECIGSSWADIARALNKDSTSIIEAHNRAVEQEQYDPAFADRVAVVRTFQQVGDCL